MSAIGRGQIGAGPFAACVSLVLLPILFVLLSAHAVRASTVTANWNPNPEPDIAGYRLLYGVASGVYTTTIDVGKVTSYVVTVLPGQTYYFVVQAYNTIGLISNNSVEVPITVAPSTAPTILSVSPALAVAGTPITIAGSNFGATQGSSTVTFNGTAATPTIWSATSIVVPVPAVATSGNVLVTVGGVASNAMVFTVNLAPTLAQVANQNSPENSAVSLQLAGNDPNGLPLAYSASSLPGGLSVNATTGLISGTLTFTSAGTYNVTATVSDGVLSTTRTFTWTVTNVNRPPVLTNPGNRTSVQGTVVSLQLAATDPDGMAPSYSASGLPPGLTTSTSGLISGTLTSVGVYSVTATVSDGSLSDSKTFTWTVTSPTPSITTLSPTSGPAATSVTITGTSFGAMQGSSTVTFNGATATPTSWSATRIVAPVPTGATTGNVVVTVGGLASNGLGFTVTVPPNLTSLSPTSGPVGTSVRITGTNFGATPGTSTVKFNGTTATPTSWSATSIVAPVPVGTTTGSVIVTVGGAASNGLPFTVNRPPTLAAVANQVSGPNEVVSLQLSGTDPDGGVLTYSATNLPPGLTVNASTGLISGTTPSAASVDTVTATVSDGALSDSKTFTWSVTQPTGNVLVSDTFTGTTGTMLTNHLPDVNLTSGGWILMSGGAPPPTLQNGRVGLPDAGPGHLQVTLDSGTADVQMGVDYRVGAAGMGALAFRVTDTNNHFVLATYQNALQIYRKQSGAYTLLASTALTPLVAGSTHRLQVRTNGAALEGWWDNVLTVQATDGFNQTATLHGLDWNSAYDASTTYDNFVLETLGAPPTPATVVISPAQISVPVGATTPATAQAFDANGTLISGASFSWVSTQPAIATVSPGGATVSVHGVGVGTTTIRATAANGVSATATIAVTQPTSNVLVSDTFTGTTGTMLTNHSPDVNLTSGGWILMSGGAPLPTLQNGRVGLPDAGPGHLQVTLDSGTADVQMGVDYRVGAGAGMGALAFRVTDTNNHFVLLTYQNALQIYRKQSGAYTLLASTALTPLPAGSTHRLEVRAHGSNLEGWWDGGLVVQTTDTFNQTATRHGLDWNSAWDSTSAYDNFLLQNACTGGC